MRVLPGDDFRYLKMEITYQASGTLLGMPAQDMGTIEVFERVPGQQTYGSGRGMLMTAGGGVIYNQHGVGTMSGDGMAPSVRFSAAAQAPADGPLARLNGVLMIGEQEVDAEGNMRTTLYEWK
jgi:hypothetical protein